MMKTEGLIVDFRRSKTPMTPVSICVVDVEIVKDYKYLIVQNVNFSKKHIFNLQELSVISEAVEVSQ